MTRYLIPITSTAARAQAERVIRQAPLGTRIEIKAAKRTLPQNDRMWAMLTDVATQKEHNGRKYTPDKWKIIFMAAMGQEIEFIPSLDGKTFIPLGLSSSDLSKVEMSQLIDYIAAWGAESGVVFHDDQAVEDAA